MDLEGERRSAKREFYLIAGFAFVLTIVIVIGAIIFINSGVIHREKARNYPVEEIFDPNVCRLKVCGGSDPKRTSPSAKIIEGDETPLGLLPFQAVFWDDSGLFCGGSMLNDRWIVSSAHCFVRRKRKFSSLRVAVGIIDADDRLENEIKIESVFEHPDHRHSSLINDIIMIKTAESISNSSINYVEPICLPYSGVDTEGDDFKTGIISGFGSTQDGSNRMSQTLRNASVKLFDHEKCSEIIEKYATFDSNLMICAGVSCAS